MGEKNKPSFKVSMWIEIEYIDQYSRKKRHTVGGVHDIDTAIQDLADRYKIDSIIQLWIDGKAQYERTHWGT